MNTDNAAEVNSVVDTTTSEVLPDVKADEKFIILSNDQAVEYAIKLHSSIILCKPVQSGKTSDVFKIVEKTYKNTITVFVSDKNSALAGQTNERAKKSGFIVVNFSAATPQRRLAIWKELMESGGKKKIFHFLMEVNNLQVLHQLVAFCKTPITLVIDEADKNRNVANYDDSDDDEDTEDENKGLPIITKYLLSIKNLLKDRGGDNKVVFVTATPQSLLVSEYDPNRLVIYKQPYKNYVGVGYKHEADVELIHAINFQANPKLPASVRWSGTPADLNRNVFRNGVLVGLDHFLNMKSKDETVKQLMLVSVESRNDPQARCGSFISEYLASENRDDVSIVVFNGANKTYKGWLLSDIIKNCANRKIIIIAGLMASRGVSFTDFSDPENKFELVVQVHNTDISVPLNTALQAMRIFGPARRTVTRPVLVCNKICAEDVKYNFQEAYRVVRDLASDLPEIDRGEYDLARPLTQVYNFRYMQQSDRGSYLLFKSRDENDWLPVSV